MGTFSNGCWFPHQVLMLVICKTALRLYWTKAMRADLGLQFIFILCAQNAHLVTVTSFTKVVFRAETSVSFHVWCNHSLEMDVAFRLIKWSQHKSGFQIAIFVFSERLWVLLKSLGKHPLAPLKALFLGDHGISNLDSYYMKHQVHFVHFGNFWVSERKIFIALHRQSVSRSDPSYAHHIQFQNSKMAKMLRFVAEIKNHWVVPQWPCPFLKIL